jgi:hypothetical protein
VNSKAAALLAFTCIAAALRAEHACAQQEFAAQAAREIDRVVSFAPPDFSFGPGREGPLGFYGKAMNEFTEISCERRASFGIIASANLAGGMNVGICVREAQRVRALAAHARPALAGTLALLSEGAARLDAAKLEKAGWTYAMTSSADGAEEHYFALLAIGHGVISLPTLVRMSPGNRRAIVIQADTMRLCENYGLRDKTPLCRDTRRALSDIAQRLELRFRD